MKVYCVTEKDSLVLKRMIYLGTSIDQAEASVGKLYAYPKVIPINFPKLYSVLPENIEREAIQFYAVDVFWILIEMFELNEEN